MKTKDTSFLKIMHRRRTGKGFSLSASSNLLLIGPSFLPSWLPSREPNMRHDLSSNSNSKKQIRDHDLTRAGTNTAGVAAADEFDNRAISASNGPKRILIVDDDQDIALFYKIALEQAGFVVDVFSDPLKSFSNYRTGVYDLVLLDVRMPQMSGFELYSKIKGIDDGVKVCFITAFEDYHNEFKKLFPHLEESECYVRKPITMQDLIRIVKSRVEYDKSQNSHQQI
jgi:CheY-like chemotaxis protein